MKQSECPSIRRALLSVSDKSHLLSLAQALIKLNIELISTGGTATELKNNNIPVTEVSEITGFPEIMDGRVKTLHPNIHAGILSRREKDKDILEKHHISNIDLVIVNLYPFQTVVNEGCDLETAIENIDIGGPTMLRAAAKNHQHVTVVVDPKDYSSLIQELKTNNNSTSLETRFNLASKAFQHTAAYDMAIANYFSKQTNNNFPDTYFASYEKKQNLRYGENPHQDAAFYIQDPNQSGTVANAEKLQGKELSYNNIADADAALQCVKELDNFSCVIVKHANPCGVATAETQIDAYQNAYRTDPTSSFGGIIAFNKTLTGETVKTILQQQFVEVIIAPDVASDALELLKQKPNIRILCCGEFKSNKNKNYDYKKVENGLLIQDLDSKQIEIPNVKVVTKRSPSDAEMADLLFSWKIVKHVKSNAIVYAKDLTTIGIGAGQMSRVYSAYIAGIKAKDENLELNDAVMASDAFFPFRDSIDKAAENGISCIIQPGGSIRDQEVIDAADEAGIAMVFTGIRHFKH